jgi:hypothetical protein
VIRNNQSIITEDKLLSTDKENLLKIFAKANIEGYNELALKTFDVIKTRFPMEINLLKNLAHVCLQNKFLSDLKIGIDPGLLKSDQKDKSW